LRYLYSLILYLMLPWVVLRLWLKGARVPGYRDNLRERFGYGGSLPAKDPIWFHAVSVGEVRAALPLVQMLQKGNVDRPLLITTTTPAGRETVQHLFEGRVYCRYLPWDLPGAVTRFLDSVTPVTAIIMETEIWPNLYRQLDRRNIRLLLVNARLSQASLKGYLRLSGLARQTLSCADRIAAQSEQDAQRFRRLGATDRQLAVVGNIKFDARLPADFEQRVEILRRRLGSKRRIWIAGSTHQGEEEQVIEAHTRVLQKHADALLVLAPRHVERAEQVAAICRGKGLACRRYSGAAPVNNTDQVVIVDVLGELVYLYGAAKIAFIGGSLVDRGGHNPVEAALAGAALLTGPCFDNFETVYREFVSMGAVRITDSAAALAEAVCGWLDDEQQRSAAATDGLQVLERKRGAVRRIVQLLDVPD
jgi:3-deoxy-D-manno-octulosonic-acid transferase